MKAYREFRTFYDSIALVPYISIVLDIKEFILYLNFSAGFLFWTFRGFVSFKRRIKIAQKMAKESR